MEKKPKKELVKKPWKTNILDFLVSDKWKKIKDICNDDEVYKIKNGDNTYILLRINLVKQDLKDYKEKIQEQIDILTKLNETPEFENTLIGIEEWSEGDLCGFEILTKYSGKSLDKLIAIIDAKQIINYAYSSLDSMIALEKNGIFHSDIKPDFLLCNKGKITTIGFYFSKDFKDFDHLMKAYAIDDIIHEYTHAYCPPETIQYLENPNCEKKSIPGKMDVYNWGMSFYHLLSQISVEELKKILELRKSYKTYGDFITFVKKLESKVCPQSGLIKQFVPILLKTLEYDPKNRPTFSEVKAMMGKFIESKENSGNII